MEKVCAQYEKERDHYKKKMNEATDEKKKKKLGTVRHLVWEKTNPSPMNGQYIYLSGIENAVWFKKKGATFNAHCKNPTATKFHLHTYITPSNSRSQ